MAALDDMSHPTYSSLMDPQKKKRLERSGWAVGTASEFLELSEAEQQFVEIKLGLARAFSEHRRHLGLTQSAVAELLGSSQSRIAKIEAADASVTIDLMLRGMLTLGVKPKKLAGVFNPGGGRRNGAVG